MTQPGFALIAVLVALVILLTLLVPFLNSALNEVTVAKNVVAEVKVKHQNQGERARIFDFAANSHPSVESSIDRQDARVDRPTTPEWDGREEFPGRIPYPEAFSRDPATQRGHVYRSSSIEDLQRKIHLPTASPLVIGNLLGLSTTVLGKHESDTDTITVADAIHFPERDGVLLVRGERIGYAEREGNVFRGIQRQFDPAPGIPEDGLVLDYRVVLAVTWQFERHGRSKYIPYSNVEEVQAIGERIGRFRKREMDVLLAHCTTYGANDFATRWGRPLRVFNERKPTDLPGWSLRTDSALGVGGGSVVRIRSLEDPDAVEYNFVWTAERPQSNAGGLVNLRQPWRLHLLFGPMHEFEPMNYVVEPLIPVAVNINTADDRVLVALLEKLRKTPNRAMAGHTRNRAQGGRQFGKQLSRAMAEEMAAEIIRKRSGAGEDSQGQPFQGWEDLSERFFYPRGKAASGDRQELGMLVMMAENMLYGRAPNAEMGTMPICFASSSLVQYRVASMQTLPSGMETARGSITGVASVMPGRTLDMLLPHQRGWLENIRLNRRSPQWITFPTSIGAIRAQSPGTDPGGIAPALLHAEFYPDIGFGNPRHARQDRGSIRMTTVTAPRQKRPDVPRPRWSYESFAYAQHPDGRELDTKEGPFDLINTGPRGGGAQKRRARHPDASFFYTGNEGMPGRHAVSFWFKLKALGDLCIYDLAADVADRNRINVRFEADHLVFEVLDEAGLDPDPSTVRTQPERTAGLWKVPVQEFNLAQDVWFHVNISADGNRPDQLSMFIDGVPRENPEYMTYLEQEIPEYEHQPGVVQTEIKERYPEIKVESTEGFPEQGVLRIGRELFEYTSKDETTFYCRPVDSMGERKARMQWREFRASVEENVDELGRPTINAEDLTGSATEDKTPPSPAGSMVELYGYAAALYRNTPIAIGSTKLRDELGTWSLARARPVNPVAIDLPASFGSFPVGDGFDLTSTSDIWLMDPIPDEKGGKAKPEATDAIIDGFPAGGGYALLLQTRLTRITGQAQGGQRVDEFRNVGGIELIQYGKRDGNKLSDITRAVKIPGTEKLLGKGANGLYEPDGTSRQFVSDWSPRISQPVRGGNPVLLHQLQNWVLYVVPISIAVVDGEALNDPLVTEVSEWAQIYPGDGNEHDTEWVRYNVITADSHLVRIHERAWQELHFALTRQQGAINMSVANGGSGSSSGILDKLLEFAAPQDDGLQRIGYIDKAEIEWPILYQARLAFHFRGDTFTNTTAHAQSGAAEVMPCHRLELDWGGLGALSARCGRNDRIAMVGGKEASGDARPSLEWHTVNWYTQRTGGDNYSKPIRNNGVEPELLGPYPFQLVAFKDGVNSIFVGPDDRQDIIDTRRVDRVVKFPSGELPAAYVEAGWFGSANPAVGDYTPATGFVDEVSAVGRSAETALLNIDVTADAMEIPMRKHRRLRSYGVIGVTEDITQSWPKDGGLMQIDSEIIAYASYADGIFQIAKNGRGLLGTEARGHADTARAQYLAHVPAAILDGQATSSANTLQVQALGSLPRFGGTLLMGRELLHYTWTIQEQLLGMPEWFDPDDEDRQSGGVGLFRGRYGTTPQDGVSGSAVIWFPFRFWDRYHERSDDPALAYYQATRRETPVFFTDLEWREENPEPSLLELRTTVNIDGAGSFADDPEKVRGLFSFKTGTVDDKANPLGWQGSTIEVRFATEFRPGAFDPETFVSNAWKQAITVKDLIIRYEGETRVLSERELNK